MSSTYRILCLSHDPAIALDAEWSSSVDGRLRVSVIAANPADHPETADHANCDLLIGRYSYPLVEIGCPAQPPEGKARHYPWHPRSTDWVDAEWLRLLLAAYEAKPDVATQDAIKRLPVCWSWERVNRLRGEWGAE